MAYVQTQKVSMGSTISFYPCWYFSGTDGGSWNYTVKPRYTRDGITWVDMPEATYHFTSSDYTITAGLFRSKAAKTIQAPITPWQACSVVMYVQVSDGTNVYSLDQYGNSATITAHDRPSVVSGQSSYVAYGDLRYGDTSNSVVCRISASVSTEPYSFIRSIKVKGYPLKREVSAESYEGVAYVDIPVADMYEPVGPDTSLYISVTGRLDTEDVWQLVNVTPTVQPEIQSAVIEVDGGDVVIRHHSAVTTGLAASLFGQNVESVASIESGNINRKFVFHSAPFDKELTFVTVGNESASGQQVSILTATVQSNGAAAINYGENMGDSISFMGEPAVSYSTALSQNVYSVAGQTLPKAFYGKSAKRSMTFTAKGTNVETPAEIDREKLEALALAGDAVLRMPGGVTHKVAVQSVAYGYGYGNKVTGITIPMVEVQ